ncbi:MAG TPA: M48 family metalloprotease, partial [Vicinamibacterales bacterium]|nr:M48 family metalloprotease [Vicinamibacterales bacterium]
MYEDLPGLPVFLTLAALAPALVVWRRGRVLARALEDPALPERLEAERRRNGSIITAAAYPLRKVLYAETWTFPTYLACVGRVVVAIWGFWVVLAVLPLQAPEFGRYDWLVALAGGMALLLWNTRADVVLRRLLGSRALTDPVLIARFTAIAERSAVPVPNFECIPLHGGAISNAIAVPARHRSSVLFTDTLLAQLDADEAAAICAHEIAHLEHHTPRLLRRLDIANVALVLLGAFLSIVPRLTGWESTALSSVLWIVALFGVLAWRARDRQKHETASDLRAIALTGDPDALVRALTKLYAFAR